MGTSYFRIYNRAISEFKDPTLKNLLQNNTILFSEVMYNFLENAVSLFTNPQGAATKVRDRSIPYTLSETFTVSSTPTNTFVLSNPPNNDIVSECIFKFTINDNVVDGEYDINTHSIILDTIPMVNDTVGSIIYYIGNFNQVLLEDEEYILSQFIVACWSEYVVNDKLDIIRLLHDTDFKLPANSTTIASKVAWGIVTKENVIKRMNIYAWYARRNKVY